EDLAERAFVDRFHFHRRFVGLDLGDNVARFHGVAFAFDPLRKIALLHRRRERGHQYFYRHRCPRQRVTSVQSSEGSGSGSCDANSAASLTMVFTSASIFLISSSLARFSSSIRARTISMGSFVVRIFSTSSLVRYF